MKLQIATGNSRMEKRWNNVEMELDEFIERISHTIRTAETVEQYMKMTKAKQDAIKDVGGFVGGRLKGGRRKKDCVEYRTIITLDIDHAVPGVIEQIELLYNFRCFIYSTHKHPCGGKRVCRMRLVYDDAMQETMAAAIGEFMDALTVGEIVRYEWGTDRVQMSMLKERLGAYLEYYRMSIGNTVTHRLPKKKGAQTDMADNEGKKQRASIYCRVGNPKDAGPCFKEKCGSPAGQERKGADADAHKESCDICEGVNRA